MKSDKLVTPKSGDRHEPDKAQHEHGGDAAAQIIRRAFLHDRAAKCEVHGQA